MRHGVQRQDPPSQQVTTCSPRAKSNGRRQRQERRLRSRAHHGRTPSGPKPSTRTFCAILKTLGTIQIGGHAQSLAGKLAPNCRPPTAAIARVAPSLPRRTCVRFGGHSSAISELRFRPNKPHTVKQVTFEAGRFKRRPRTTRSCRGLDLHRLHERATVERSTYALF